MGAENFILADGRWAGAHGIGRFSEEILSRLHQTDILKEGPSPLGMKNLFWLPAQLTQKQNKYSVFFSPGFMPPLYSKLPFVFTIHDLIHIHGPGNHKFIHKMIYHSFIKLAARRASRIITVSEYSKNEISSWAKIAAEKIAVIKNGVSAVFTPEGDKHQPGYPYFLYVGNTKPHKNVPRLIQAFAKAKLSSSFRLVLTGQPTAELQQLIEKKGLQMRVVFSGSLTEIQLASYYRGATALLFPSLYEGFGLPIIEAMASGTPVITSNVTSLPEVAGNAAIMINPLDIDALTFHIEQIVANDALRQSLITKGLKQASGFSWDTSAQTLQRVLSEV